MSWTNFAVNGDDRDTNKDFMSVMVHELALQDLPPEQLEQITTNIVKQLLIKPLKEGKQ